MRQVRQAAVHPPTQPTRPPHLHRVPHALELLGVDVGALVADLRVLNVVLVGSVQDRT